MRHFIVFTVALAFAFCALVSAADKPSDVPSKTQPVKTAPIKAVKETRISFTGIVKEISNTTIMVERTVKGNVETMEFALDKAVENIKAGDRVKVSYIKKEDKNIAIKVAHDVVKKIIRKMAPAKEAKTAPTEAQPPKK